MNFNPIEFLIVVINKELPIFVSFVLPVQIYNYGIAYVVMFSKELDDTLNPLIK